MLKLTPISERADLGRELGGIDSALTQPALVSRHTEVAALVLPSILLLPATTPVTTVDTRGRFGGIVINRCRLSTVPGSGLMDEKSKRVKAILRIKRDGCVL
jgi:hypothetical protein